MWLEDESRLKALYGQLENGHWVLIKKENERMFITKEESHAREVQNADVFEDHGDQATKMISLIDDNINGKIISRGDEVIVT